MLGETRLLSMPRPASSFINSYSSIGMAKAALDAMDGMNLFGEEGPRDCIIHVDPDAQYRNHVILDTLLPKESSSKETDAALLCITGFPAFAIKDIKLVEETEEKLKQTLEVSGCRKVLCVGSEWIFTF